MKKLNLKFGVIDVAAARAAISSARENLAGIYPGYDPLKKHRGSDPAGTSSRFYGEDLPDIADEDATEVIPGNEPGSFVLVVTASKLVGNTVVPPTPVKGHAVIVEDEDGHGLQARPTDDLVLAPCAEKSVRTWCAALTPEEKDGETFLVLASAYPGVTDQKPNMEGLHDGSIIDADEIRRRRIRVRA